MKLTPFVSVAALCVAGAFAAHAQAPAPAAPAPAAAPSTAIDLGNGISMSGHAEFGVSINPSSPDNNINFGQAFTDGANAFRMNQAMLNIERDIDPKQLEYQWGFKFTGMYGTDSRYTHFLNEFDRVTNSPYQWDVVEADVQARLPYWLGGTDVKLGQYPTPIGYEVIDATGNPLYSHSYIFNYGLPFKHTGLLTTTHVNDMIDIWAGLDAGVNDSIGQKGMANNYFPKFLVGVGLNGLMDGNLTILALGHFGPENARFLEPVPGGPVGFVAGANTHYREYYDGVITYKISDALTSVTELNYVHDDLLRASAGGAATYLTYVFNDTWAITGRAEAFADQNGFAVVSFQGSQGIVNAQRGLQPLSGYGANVNTGGAAYNIVYGELTLGATYKPAISDMFNVMIRPEMRWDSVVGGSSGLKPYNINSRGLGTDSSQFTFAVDLIVGF